MVNSFNDFKKNKITSPAEEIAARLRQARQEKKISLNEAAERLNINIRYLTALEEERWQDLPAGLYGKNFLRRYGEFLGLKTNELINLYNQEEKKSLPKSSNLFNRKIPKTPLALPKIIKNSAIAFLILLCLGYLGYYVNNITKPPELIIIQPPKNITTNENYIVVRGLTETETDITINGENILPTETGNFSKKINLKEGINTIVITAKKKYSRRRTVTRKVLVKK
jgi:transcriptional regulator with XRE-family HTH domain